MLARMSDLGLQIKSDSLAPTAGRAYSCSVSYSAARVASLMPHALYMHLQPATHSHPAVIKQGLLIERGTCLAVTE